MKALTIPPLPSIIRYYDEYSEQEYAVEPQVAGNLWEVFSEGSVQQLNFAVFSEGLIRDMAKWLVAHCLATVRSGTAALAWSGLRTVPEDDVISILTAVPHDAPFVWERMIARERGMHSYTALKSLLYVACAIRFGGWRPDHADYLNTSFPLPKRDKYASVKAGLVFLALDAEKRVIAHLDEVTARRQAATEHELIDAGILLCNYAFGLRPTQIGRLRRRDVTIRMLADGTLSVHLRFQMVKQSATATRLTPLNRRLPYRWAGLFQEIEHRR
ncbi:MAG: hypothetical protein AAB092_04810, partial [Chloroflexota bacterium]